MMVIARQLCQWSKRGVRPSPSNSPPLATPLVSAHITLCAAVYTMRRITVSACITFCAVVFTIRRVSAHGTLTFHSIPIDVISQSISYVTKYTDCSVLRNRMTHTLFNGAVLYFLISHSNKHRLHIFSHSVLWFSLRDVYRYQPISHSSCRFSMAV